MNTNDIIFMNMDELSLEDLHPDYCNSCSGEITNEDYLIEDIDDRNFYNDEDYLY